MTIKTMTVLVCAAIVGLGVLLLSAVLGGWGQTSEHRVIPLWDPPYELSGEGYTIAAWDYAMPVATHPDLVGRVAAMEALPGDDPHATHIAGILAASGEVPQEPELSRAAAYKSEVACWDYLLAGTEMLTATAMGMPAANCGWQIRLGMYWNPFKFPVPGWSDDGTSHLFGAYAPITQEYDGRVFDAAQAGSCFVVVFPAGDDRDDGPGATVHDGEWHPEFGGENPYFDTMSPLASGKNTIAVGATAVFPVTGEITHFSNWGPADDNRVKPDLVARGEMVFSTFVGGDAGLYINADGTDQAAALVTSASLLVMEQYSRTFAVEPATAEVKGLLLYGAEDRGHVGPDAIYGFGYTNVQAAVDTVLFDAGYRSRVLSSTVADGATVVEKLWVEPGTERIELLLTWIDPPGSTSAPEALVNNLDLSLIDPQGGRHYPYRIDPHDVTAPALTDAPNTVDNVEQLVVEQPASGTWTVEIAGTDVPQYGPQDFALVSGAPLHAGAAGAGSIVYDRNANGDSVDLAWSPVTDPDLVEWRLYRSEDPENGFELAATIAPGEQTYTDTPPPGTLYVYDLRAVWNRRGEPLLSRRPEGFHSTVPRMLSPLPGELVPYDGTPTRILGEAEPSATVTLYEDLGGGNRVELATTQVMDNGLFWFDHDFGGAGTVRVTVESRARGRLTGGLIPKGISLPALTLEFELGS